MRGFVSGTARAVHLILPADRAAHPAHHVFEPRVPAAELCQGVRQSSALMQTGFALQLQFVLAELTPQQLDYQVALGLLYIKTGAGYHRNFWRNTSDMGVGTVCLLSATLAAWRTGGNLLTI
jgi:hypothetical protein